MGADRRIHLFEKLLASAIFVPRHQHVRIHRECRAGAPKRERRLLPVVVDEHAVAAVECSFRHRVKQAECRHHGAGRQHLDPEIAAGHVIDFFCEIEREFVKDILGGPSTLPAHGDRALRPDDVWRRDARRGSQGRTA
jgi:hypothetical protein